MKKSTLCLIALTSFTAAQNINAVKDTSFLLDYWPRVDTPEVSLQIINKSRLNYSTYFDYYTAIGVADFSETFVEFVALPYTIKEDKVYHWWAGRTIGLGSAVAWYKITKRPILSIFLGGLTGSLVGWGKEWIDPKIGGTRSVKDGWTTTGGSFRGALDLVIPIGRKRLYERKVLHSRKYDF